MSQAKIIQDAPIRTTRDLQTSTFFGRLSRGIAVDVVDQAIADNGQPVTKIRMKDGTEGWTSSWHLDVHAAAGSLSR